MNTNNVFDELITTFTFGLFNDLKTLVLGALTIVFLLAAIDLIVVHFFGRSISEELEYRQYAADLRKREAFERRYENENDSSAMGPSKPASGRHKYYDGTYF